MCELASGEKLQGGPGYDTLILPIEAALVRAANVTFDGFENIVVDPDPCRAECSTAQACNGNGSCVDGANPGEKVCVCSYYYVGVQCNMAWVSPISCDTCTSHVVGPIVPSDSLHTLP